MARTKQGKTNSSSSNPMKRRRDYDDENTGNQKKKIKQDFSESLESESDSSHSSSSSISSSDIESSSNEIPSSVQNGQINHPEWSEEMKKAMELVGDILRSPKYELSVQLEFANELKTVVSDAQSRCEEIKFRQEERHRRISSKNEKLRAFAEHMIRGYRWREIKDEVEYDAGGAIRWKEYSLDIAIKSSSPHPKYKQKMHELLKKCMPQVHVADIIIDYAQIDHRWYRIEYKMDTPDDDGGYCPNIIDSNSGIFWNIKYDERDYFRSMELYWRGKPRTKGKVSLAEMRKMHDDEYMRSMSDADLAQLILDIDSLQLGGALRDQYMDEKEWELWISKEHK